MGIVLGIAVGIILGLINFKLLSITVKRAINMVSKKASILIFLSYLLRYIFIAFIAIAFIKFLGANVFALVISLVIANTLPTFIIRKKTTCQKV